MIRTLLMLGILGTFLGFGLFGGAPFICGLGYVWLDAAHPQSIAWTLFNRLPLGQVMGAAAFFGYLLTDRRDPPRLNLTICLLILFSVWITLSTAFWAVVPDSAWFKWNWAFKSIAFAAFLPFLFRSRVQIEAFLQVFVFSCMVNIIGPGAKTLVTGGGYASSLGFASENGAYLSEGSTLATIAILLIPIILHLRKYTLLLPHTRFFQLGYYGMVPIAVLATIGTFERTGLVTMAVLSMFLWVRSKHKMAFGVMLVIGALLIGWRVSEQWISRISTIATYTSDDSAMARLAVWKWTYNYVLEHPLGGGFDAYRINTIEVPPAPGSMVPEIEHGRAFHSIYFEVLGEQGWVGLALFLGIIGSSIRCLRQAAKRSAGIADLEWARDLAKTLFGCFLIILCGGAFIGIAFEPFLYYLCAASVCLSEYVRRYLTEAKRADNRRFVRTGRLPPAIIGPTWAQQKPQMGGVFR